jgi:hypothetical protein
MQLVKYSTEIAVEPLLIIFVLFLAENPKPVPTYDGKKKS